MLTYELPQVLTPLGAVWVDSKRKHFSSEVTEVFLSVDITGTFMKPFAAEETTKA